MNKYHLGIIPDGNRRWATANNTTFYNSYILGLRKLIEIFDLAFNQSFNEISVYCLSTENLKRSTNDLEAALNSQIDFMNNELKIYQVKKGARIKGVGELHLLPVEYQKSILDLENYKTEKDYKINLLVAYNPFYEIYNSLKKVSLNDPDEVLKHLYVNRNVDLLIRTAGGKCPLSNFLPLQCGYASVFITETHLNEINSNELSDIFASYFNISQKTGL